MSKPIAGADHRQQPRLRAPVDSGRPGWRPANAANARDRSCPPARDGATGTCPHCCSDRIVRWGWTGRGLQRRRCRLCRLTFTAATGTFLAGARARDRLPAVIADMLAPQPLSCRVLGSRLALSRMTVWRWRRLIALGLNGGRPATLARPTEIGHVSLRESRKASREWLDHARHPETVSPPDRLRWVDYSRLDVPLPDPMTGHLVHLTLIRDRHGHTAVAIAAGRASRQALNADVDQPTVAAGSIGGQAAIAAVHPAGTLPSQSPPTAVVSTTTGAHRSHSLEDAFRRFIAPFAGPATRHLPVYTSWFAARSDGREATTRRILQLWRKARPLERDATIRQPA